MALSVFMLQKRWRRISHTVSFLSPLAWHTTHVHGTLARSIHCPRADQVLGDDLVVARHRHLDYHNQQLPQLLLHPDHRLLILLLGLVHSSRAAMVQMQL